MGKKWDKFVHRAKQVGEVAVTATKALALAKTVAHLVNVEKKIGENVASTLGTVNTSGSVTPASLIAQGANDGERNGNSIKALHFDYDALVYTPATQNTPYAIRCIVFKDNEQDGVLPAVTDVLTSADVTSPYNKFNMRRFKILYDSHIKIGGVFQAPNTYNKIKLRKKLNHHIRYDSTGATQAAQKEGNIYILWVSTNSTAGQIPSVIHSWRLTYVDN